MLADRKVDNWDDERACSHFPDLSLVARGLEFHLLSGVIDPLLGLL